MSEEKRKAAFILDGAGSKDEFTHSIGEAFARLLRERGWRAEPFIVCEKRIHPCVGCSSCAFRTPGICIFQDDGQDLPRHQAECDLMAIVTTLSFGGFSSTTKRAFERTMPYIHPCFVTYQGEMHHRLRYSNRPPIIYLGWQPKTDEISAGIFSKLAERSARNLQTRHAELVVSEKPAQEELSRLLSSFIERSGVLP